MFAFVFGWNNSGLTTGSLSKLVSYNLSLFLTITGIFAGFLILGPTMAMSILGKLVSKSLPTAGLFSAIVVSVLMLLVLTLFKLPVSLSNCTVGAFVGAALARGTLIKFPVLVEIVGSWIVVPFGCALLSFALYELVVRVEQSRSLVSVVRANRLILAATVFFVSFMLGGNNLGVIESLAVVGSSNGLIPDLFELLLFGSATLGIVLFGKMLAAVVGDKIVGLSQIKTFAAILAAAIIILVLTFLSIPVSLTQVIIGGMLGAGVTRRPWVVNTREIGILIAGWAGVTLVSAGLAYAVSLII
ncbi:MAG TPA: inorganic phosphate transporter [Nitrososphaerales archaeon]|nr:inorganic phosphate transporter [Nitrososphaerales archaeon]